ncbi:MAG: alkaline phosphatase D family protein [Crocosphaera sp.]|nr:alkaline phosphatase D family protein [Crocosphaera sp.]
MPKAEWFWSGAITDNSAIIKVKLNETTQDVRIAFSLDINLESNVTITAPQSAKIESGNIASFILEGLEEDTTYYYEVRVGSKVSPEKGSFKTVKVNNTFSFTIGCSGCARGSLLDIFPRNWQVSNNEIFDIIRTQNNPSLTFFLHLGDFHYRDINNGDIQRYRRAYNDVFAQERQRKLYENLPIAYVWDDHDFTGNNSDGKDPGKYAASQVYRETFPHYPLIETLDNQKSTGAIYHSFIIGRVRFILTDSRFHRNLEKVIDPHTQEEANSMLGTRQREWLLQQLKEGDEKQGCTIWVNSIPWIAKKQAGEDSWGGFDLERKLIANFIQENKINKLVMVSGDAHMLALDDGRNNKYADGGGGSFPVIQAASLSSNPSQKGGPYYKGPFPGNKQWGLLKFNDDGHQISLNVQLKKEAEEILIEETFLFSDEQTRENS